LLKLDRTFRFGALLLCLHFRRHLQMMSFAQMIFVAMLSATVAADCQSAATCKEQDETSLLQVREAFTAGGSRLARESIGFFFGEIGKSCPDGTTITSAADCQRAGNELKKQFMPNANGEHVLKMHEVSEAPYGCTLNKQQGGRWIHVSGGQLSKRAPQLHWYEPQYKIGVNPSAPTFEYLIPPRDIWRNPRNAPTFKSICYGEDSHDEESSPNAVANIDEEICSSHKGMFASVCSGKPLGSECKIHGEVKSCVKRFEFEGNPCACLGAVNAARLEKKVIAEDKDEEEGEYCSDASQSGVRRFGVSPECEGLLVGSECDASGLTKKCTVYMRHKGVSSCRCGD